MKEIHMHIIRKAAVVAALLVLVLTPAASADSPDVVTKREYKQIEEYMSRHAVQAIYDTHGERLGSWTGTGGHFHILKGYDKPNGETTTVIFRCSLPGENHPEHRFYTVANGTTW